MKEQIKKDLPKLVGFTAAMVAVDVISNKSFDFGVIKNCNNYSRLFVFSFC